MCSVIIGTIPLPLCFLGCKTLGQALGFCMSQQNTWPRGLFLNYNTTKPFLMFQTKVSMWKLSESTKHGFRVSVGQNKLLCFVECGKQPVAKDS